jgi:hypothetical protein
MQINIISSHHSKPLFLVCVDNDGNTGNQKMDTFSVPDPERTFADPTLSQDSSDPSLCRDSNTSESRPKYSSSQGNDEKDEVDELLEGVSF